ncbi:hypothetical protein [Chryseolinea sp. H1M3-3]|uniref:hypothetical protein n=1 Tax=Chryseolinea sp. H1M3-3 TaxID=3034144 RepID=UPI0023EC13D2|nr:hypothetical protein [Chryseolinea sp. H1M3-3]
MSKYIFYVSDGASSFVSLPAIMCTWLLIIQYAYKSSPLFSLAEGNAFQKNILIYRFNKSTCLVLAIEPIDRSACYKSGQLPDRGF